MSTLADLREELAADRIALSELINDFGVLESRFTTLTEDPTAVTVVGIQGFIDELDTFRVRGNEILKRFNALPNLIRATGSGPVGATEREALLADQQQLAGQTQSWISNTFVPFRDTARAEAARVTREDTAAAEKAKSNPDPVSEWTATLNDGSGPGDTGTYYVVNENGEIAPNGTNLTQQAAQLLADDLNVGVGVDPDPVEAENNAVEDASRFRAVFNDGTGPGPEGTWFVLGPGGQTSFSGKGRAAAEAEAQRLNDEAETAETEASNTAAIEEASSAERAAAVQQALKNQLQAQATRAAQRKQANEGDWRVKLRLAENANYLYRDPNLNEQGIMWPLALTNGVVFPYTPTISTSYNANYTDQALTHSNYKGYFYQSSHVGEISIQAQFTAQDTTEANYLLAVIHFFRSVTKMFYGQDAQRGAPPPLVFLQGLGEMQFNLHPCVVSQFQYSLPADVDYIRARTTNIAGAAQDSLLFRRARQTTSATLADAKNTRLSNSGLQAGARTTLPGPGTLGQGSATQGPTYVPTKMEMILTLLPMQTRLQQSQEFSVRDFANGNLQRGGFW
jgi:hypothetical protein